MSDIEQKQLETWVDTLDTYELKTILIQCIGYLADTEDIRISKSPYWISNGERLDGKELYEED